MTINFGSTWVGWAGCDRGHIDDGSGVNFHGSVEIPGAEVEVIGPVRFVSHGDGVIASAAGFVEQLRDHAALGVENLDDDAGAVGEGETQDLSVLNA